MSLYSMRAGQLSFNSSNGYRNRVSAVCNAYGRSAFLALDYIAGMVGTVKHFDGFKTVGIAVLV